MLTRCIAVVAIASIVALVAMSPATGEIPRKLNYQGRLTDVTAGEPMVGTYNLTCSIYDQSSGGDLLWSEPETVATDSAGVFSVVLGSVIPIDISFDAPCWLEIQVDGETLAPRREMVSVPYAFQALNADSLGQLSSASYSLVGHRHDDLYVNEGELNSITAGMIVGGEGSGLDADLLDGQHAAAFAAASHNHDDRYYTATELNSAGTINQTSNPVDWTKLKSVPAGFADGTDNVGAGDGYSLDAADGNPTDVVYVANDGNVGVGLTNPTLGKLQVMGSDLAGVYASSINGTGILGFSQNGNGVVGVSNNGLAGAFVGEVHTSGRVDSDSGFSIDGQTLLFAPGKENLLIGRHIGGLKQGSGKATCLGDSTAYVDVGGRNTFLGYNAGHGTPRYYGGATPLTSEFNVDNVFIGAYAGYKNRDSYNVFVGSKAGRHSTDGYYNTLVGANAALLLTTGAQNTCLGTAAGQQMTTGQQCVMCGAWAGATHLAGLRNVYVGFEAGDADYGGLATTGDYNTVIGSRAGVDADGSRNVFLGYEAGYGVNGDDKLFIANGRDTADVLIYGDFAQHRIGIGTTNPERALHIRGDGPRILIEGTSGSPEVNFENTDDTAAQRWAIYKHSTADDLRFYQNGDRVTFQNGTGNVAIGATDPGGYRLYVNGSAYAAGGWNPSDLRLKTELASIDDALDKVLRLNGVSFRWRTEQYADRGFPQGRHYGLVAQEVEEVLPEVVGSGPDGEKALAYSEIIPVLVESIKQLKAENDELRARITAIENRGTPY
jgi:hypothetical protein